MKLNEESKNSSQPFEKHLLSCASFRPSSTVIVNFHGFLTYKNFLFMSMAMSFVTLDYYFVFDYL